MNQNRTEAPQFTEPDYSYRFEQLSEDQKQHFYKKKYTMKYTKKEVLKITGIGFAAFATLVVLLGSLVRFLVWLFMFGFNGFGLW